MTVDEHAVYRGTVGTSQNNATLCLQGGKPTFCGELRVVNSNLAHEPRTRKRIAQDAGGLDVGGEDILALTSLVTGGVLQLTLVDIDSVIDSARRSGMAWLNLEVASLLLVWKEEEGKRARSAEALSRAGRNVGQMNKYSNSSPGCHGAPSSRSCPDKGNQ